MQPLSGEITQLLLSNSHKMLFINAFPTKTIYTVIAKQNPYSQLVVKFLTKFTIKGSSRLYRLNLPSVFLSIGKFMCNL